MKKVVLPVCLLLTNCATTGSMRGESARPEHASVASDARIADLERRNLFAERELRELRARYELVQAEARELRDRRETRLAEALPRVCTRANAENQDEPAEDQAEDSAPRNETPTRLVLYGAPARSPSFGSAPAAPASPFMIPPPPDGVSTQLPVVPLPGARGAVAFANAPPPATPEPAAVAATDEVATDYRRGLELYRAGRLDEAVAAFSAFVATHPTHAYAVNAVYWRGEVRYAQRQYAFAAREFRSVVDRNPRGAKAADALLKIGLCHLRMGERERARATFLEVQRVYPNTEAARLASRESVS